MTCVEYILVVYDRSRKFYQVVAEIRIVYVSIILVVLAKRSDRQTNCPPTIPVFPRNHSVATEQSV